MPRPATRNRLLAAAGVAAALMVAIPQAPAFADGNRSGIDACAQEAKNAGFPEDLSSQGRNDDAIYAVAIAMAESNCNNMAVHTNLPTDPDPGTQDLGAWQINERWHPEVHGHDAGVVTDQNWQDLGWSAREAYAIDHNGDGRGWAAWASWGNGRVWQFMDQAKAAVYRNW
ncbi:hypothetical protein [Kitasatospora kifunensis]|uniref:Transglycosylase SLT domain-containing protein n=1 Tax=Kitasatospora kifunensis TaxID=58351 RepID=A0A7W7VT27_KITKI|nr:hypothetical protein [Kitasatospora kifunensis]MBB4921762.1 hypothetical protein [Kitasatospora kifunensis]